MTSGLDTVSEPLLPPPDAPSDDDPTTEWAGAAPSHGSGAVGPPPQLAEVMVLARGEQRRMTRTGAAAGWPVEQLQWVSSAPEVATVSSRGVVMATKSGHAQITVSYAGAMSTHGVDVVPMTTGGVTVVDRRPLRLPPGSACQGILVTPHGRFTTANRVHGVPVLARLGASFDVLALVELQPPGWSALHAGSIAARGDELYVAMMDPVSYATNGPASPVKIGLGRRDVATLDDVGFYDLTGVVSYLDAIDAADDYLWLSSAGTFVRFPLGADGPDVASAVWYRKTVPGELQGLRVQGDRLFAVLENTTSDPQMAGLLEFDVNSLVPAVSGDAWDPSNSPVRHFPFAFPSAESPDHESFDFDEVDPRIVYITDIPMNELITVRLGD